MIPVSRLLNLKISRCVGSVRQCSKYKTKLYMKTTQMEVKEHVDHLIKNFAPRLIYNTIIEKKVVKFEYQQRRERFKNKTETVEPIPLTLKYLDDSIGVKCDTLKSINENHEQVSSDLINFPYDTAGYSVEKIEQQADTEPDAALDMAATASEEVRKRYEFQKDMKNWMMSYDNYDDSCMYEDDALDIGDLGVNYGTPDPTSKISNIPCGGCGALLHCKDTAIPGYIPSEIFKNSVRKGGSNLEAVICQRCHFLKFYNVALQVQVTPDDYPKVLSTVSEKRGLVILMVDLLDFPCSIWPGIGEIFGSRTPMVIVGNKIDLLLQDSKEFLTHITQTLLNTVKLQGFATFDIKDVALISAKTGYGVEDLITKLNSLHMVRGDVYIVGCTNVGKSSLFNTFLHSDYCKTQALDLIQRATTSVWPGTTLNLLKFPIKRPLGYRQYLRLKRLETLQKTEAEERQFRKEQLKITKHPKFASLVGHIDITRNPSTDRGEEPRDLFVTHKGDGTGIFRMGIKEDSPEFAQSKWCYDTPGVVQPDQIIHLLTTDELLLTLPKELIIPRTYCVKPHSSLFIAGLARLDYMHGPGSVRLTVFASNELPITICDVEEADELYNELLGTDLMKVPVGDSQRLTRWPKLEVAKQFKIRGAEWHKSSNDVVLSSAGWIALTGRKDLEYSFKAWTPEKRGVYVRDCLLPKAVALKGRRIKHSVTYHKYRFYLK